MGWWDVGEGAESALRLHFHLRKIGRIYIKIHLYHILSQIICVTSTRIEVVKENRIFCKTLAGKTR